MAARGVMLRHPWAPRVITGRKHLLRHARVRQIVRSTRNL